MSGPTVTCFHCGETFVAENSEADALMEMQEVFTEEMRSLDEGPPVVICGDCYQRMMAEQPPAESLESMRYHSKRGNR